MKEILNKEPCYGKIDGGTFVRQKPLKAVVWLVVMLVIVGIGVYGTAIASNNGEGIATDVMGPVLPQSASKATLSEDRSDQTEQNLGEYLESLSELNTVAVDNDAVFVFVPLSEDALMDDTTRAAVMEAQQVLADSNIAVGLYTLSYDSEDHAILAKQVELPGFFVASKGASAVWVSDSNADVNTLLQAYLACCDDSSGCCP